MKIELSNELCNQIEEFDYLTNKIIKLSPDQIRTGKFDNDLKRINDLEGQISASVNQYYKLSKAC